MTRVAAASGGGNPARRSSQRITDRKHPDMLRKTVRIAAASAALLVASTVGLGTAALAADPTTASIDPNAQTSLTIHKYEGPVNASADCNKNDGQPVDSTCLTGKAPLSGAEFAIYKVQDLKTNADWQKAQDTYAGGVYDIVGKSPVMTVKTDSSGVATANLQVALYYVVETKTPEGYTGSNPFFITLPMTDPSNSAWDYALDVYPKNDKKADNHKAVKDGNTATGEQSSPKVGDTLTYEVSTNVPNYGDVVGAPAAGSNTYTGPDGKLDHNDLPSFWVDDYFVSDLKDVAVKSVNLAGANLASSEYAVKSQVNADGTTSVRVYLTQAGLDKAAASNGAAIIVSYTAVVKSVPDSGEIENRAYTVPGPKPSSGSEKPNFEPSTPPDTPPTPPTPGEPTNEVVSKFGKIRITKTASDTNKKLEGAVFDVYRAKITYGEDGKTISATSCAPSDLKSATSLATLTTGADGTAVSDWLQVSDWYNDGVEKAENGNNDGHLDGGQYAAKYGKLAYCLVETKAPTGYQLLAEPVKFELTEVGATANPAAAYTYTDIKNQPDNLTNKLPLTGGEGVALFSLAGLVLIGGGLGYYAWTQRRRRDS
ncbi:SpaH/EbpB family LPXTG-anchored major pilin [Schaalia hyovaginalis]|nr:SpaH/EbpB family LPXTG-anchored major pilin [Schaalia hyovaginalis]